MRNLLKILLLFSLPLVAYAGPSESIPITLISDPPGAMVFEGGTILYRGQVLLNAGSPIQTPFVYNFDGEGTYLLKFVKPGYAEEDVRLNVCLDPSCPTETNVKLWQRQQETYTLDESRLTAGAVDAMTNVSSNIQVRIVDWDYDGRPDIGFGDCTSETIQFMSNSSKRDITLGSALAVDMPLPAMVSLPCPRPFIIDWNNDGYLDFLLGLATGGFYIWTATGLDPITHSSKFELTNPPSALTDQFSTPITVPSNGMAWVMDANLDGMKDLVVADENGLMMIYYNDPLAGGTDAAPVFETGAPFGPALETGLTDLSFLDLDFNGTLDLLVIYSNPNPTPGIWVYPNMGSIDNPRFSEMKLKVRFRVGDNLFQELPELSGFCPQPWSMAIGNLAQADRTRSRELFIGCGNGEYLQFRAVDLGGDLNNDGIVNGLDIINVNIRKDLPSTDPRYSGLADVPGWRNADLSTPMTAPTGNPSTYKPGEEYSAFHRDGTIDAEDRSRIEQFFGRGFSNCGNGTQDAGEDCDDGNLRDNDGCSAFCRDEGLNTVPDNSCGNGLPDLGEVCDDGVFNGYSCFCDNFCLGYVAPVCGDGKLCEGEYCDDGDTTESGYCSADCQWPASGGGTCGNGVIEGVETCDTAIPGQECCEPTFCVGLATAGTVCRTALGECDIQEVCTGAMPNCPTDAFWPVGFCCGVGCAEPICNPDVCDGMGICEDIASAPDGSDCGAPNSCQSAVCSAPGPVCGDGTLDAGETCDPGIVGQECCDPVTCLGPVIAGPVCRAATGQCDLDEQCNGVSVDCPADEFQPAGTCCGAGCAEPVCDPDSCDGSGTCADNPWLPNGADCGAPNTCDNGVCGILPASGECCMGHGSPGCDVGGIQSCVCGFDPSCCGVEWTTQCATIALMMCGTPCDSNCCAGHGGMGCSDSGIATCVCGMDFTCCTGAWTEACADLAVNNCGAVCSP